MSETRPGGRKCKTYPDELEKRVGTSHDDLAAKPLPLPLESTLGAYQWRAREREISCSRPEETAPACSRRSRAHRQQIISAVIAAQLGRVQLLTPETRHLAIAVTRLREGAPAQPASAVS
jgi:hypothetical protein